MVIAVPDSAVVSLTSRDVCVSEVVCRVLGVVGFIVVILDDLAVLLTVILRNDVVGVSVVASVFVFIFV